MLCSIWYTSKLSPCWDLHSPVANQDLSTLKLFEMRVGTSVWCAVDQWWNSVDGKYVSWDGWGKSAAISPNNCFTVTSTFRQFFFNTETLPACTIQFLGMDTVPWYGHSAWSTMTGDEINLGTHPDWDAMEEKTVKQVHTSKTPRWFNCCFLPGRVEWSWETPRRQKLTWSVWSWFLSCSTVYIPSDLYATCSCHVLAADLVDLVGHN